MTSYILVENVKVKIIHPKNNDKHHNQNNQNTTQLSNLIARGYYDEVNLDQFLKFMTKLCGINFPTENTKHYNFQIDQFEKFEKIGQGNFGTVYKAIHKPTNFKCAVKKIRSNFTLD